MSDSSRVMLFIDADNVSADVIGQAIAKVKADHGAIHVRRAHCTAEVALKHAKLFKNLSIRPIVNLASGKNSTDIALAVDAMEMVCAERPQLVVIVSSDSDFAPLVIRLREKGCRVCGIGQRGKTGDEVIEVYDEFIDLEHRKTPPAPRSGPPPRPRGGRGERPAAREPQRPGADAAGRDGARADRPAATRGPERGDGRSGRGSRRRGPRDAERFADLPADDRPTDHEIDRAMGWPPGGRGADRPGRAPAEPVIAAEAIEPTVDVPAEAPIEAAVEPTVDAGALEPAIAPVAEAGEPVPAKRSGSRRPRGKAAREAAAAGALPAAVAPSPRPAPDPAVTESLPSPRAAAVSPRQPSPASEQAVAERPPLPRTAATSPRLPPPTPDPAVAKPPPSRAASASPRVPQPASESAVVAEQTPSPRAAASSRVPPPSRVPAAAEPPPLPATLPGLAPPPPVLSEATLAALAASDLPDEVRRLLEAIPELLGGSVFELSHAAERLRTVGLLAKNAPSTKLFKKYPDLFALTPGRQPNKVRFSGSALA